MRFKKAILVVCFWALKTQCFAQNLALIDQKNDNLTIKYHDNAIFSAKIVSNGSLYTVHTQNEVINGSIFQIVALTSNNFKPIELKGAINASGDAIACESEPADKSLKVVRHVARKSRSLLNNALYERRDDWLFSFDKINQQVRITPGSTGSSQTGCHWLGNQAFAIAKSQHKGQLIL